jgi:hypothetical protein
MTVKSVAGRNPNASSGRIINAVELPRMMRCAEPRHDRRRTIVVI